MEFENNTFSDDAGLESDKPPYEKLENETYEPKSFAQNGNLAKSSNFPWKKLFLANFLASAVLTLAAILPAAFLLKSYIDGKTEYIHNSMHEINNKLKTVETIGATIQESKMLEYLNNTLSSTNNNISRLENMTRCLACDAEVPKWPENGFRIQVKEDALVGTSVAMLTPSTCSGNTAFSEYILYGTSNFTINNGTGVVILNSPLDRESIPEYRYNVAAAVTCSGMTRRGPNTTVIFEIQDVNDNSPVFERSDGFETSIDSNATIGTLVIKVNATDADIGDNGQIYYELSPQTVPFNISINGDIRTNADLTLQPDQSVYFFTVHAKDGGVPPRNSSIPVHVSVHFPK